MLERRAAAVMPEERLRELLTYHYGLTLQNISPVSRGWKLKTNRGIFTLSRVEKMDETYWDMIDRLLLHFQERGLSQLPVLIRTEQGKLAFNGFHSRYLLWKHLHGTDCNWAKPDTWRVVGATLATIHRASRDFDPKLTYDHFTAAGKWSALWERNLKLLDTIGTACNLSANQRPADRQWMRIHNYATTLIETALRYLDTVGGDNEVSTHMREGTVSQHHLNRSSWAVNRGGSCTLLDWQHTVRDIRVRDLAQMIHLAYGDKAVFRARVLALLKGYESVHPLQKAEWPLLYVRMLFPEQLVKTARDVYEDHRISPEDTIHVLKRVIEDQRRREYHLRYMPRMLKDIGHVSIPEVNWLGM